MPLTDSLRSRLNKNCHHQAIKCEIAYCTHFITDVLTLKLRNSFVSHIIESIIVKSSLVDEAINFLTSFVDVDVRTNGVIKMCVRVLLWFFTIVGVRVVAGGRDMCRTAKHTMPFIASLNGSIQCANLIRLHYPFINNKHTSMDIQAFMFVIGHEWWVPH